MILIRYLLSLLLTILIEVGIAALLRPRPPRVLQAVALVNLITHPLLHLVLAALIALGGAPFGRLAPLEIAVAAAEWRLLLWVYQCDSPKWLALSVCMNGASYGAGILLGFG